MRLIDADAFEKTLESAEIKARQDRKYVFESAINTIRGNLRNAPSVQPEIVRCKDCKWKQGSECVRFSDVRPFPDDFCSRAERRTDDLQ